MKTLKISLTINTTIKVCVCVWYKWKKREGNIYIPWGIENEISNSILSREMENTPWIQIHSKNSHCNMDGSNFTIYLNPFSYFIILKMEPNFKEPNFRNKNKHVTLSPKLSNTFHWLLKLLTYTIQFLFQKINYFISW